MASASTKAATTKSILKPVATLKGHGERISSMSYFPDGQRMISGSDDKTARQWDVKAGKEIEKAWNVCEKAVHAVAISRDGRWVATGGGDDDCGELKACEVETGIVRTFKGHSSTITCIDISADNTWLASGSDDFTARIWNLDTGKLVAGPFKSKDWVGAVRFSPNSKKLVVKSWVGVCLEVWDVQSQKLDVRIGTYGGDRITYAPVFWTNDSKNIIAAFSFTRNAPAKTIYEFDASTLQTVGTPFQGHTDLVTGLALSLRGALLASASHDNTIKLWDCESRQLLASFDVQSPQIIVLSTNSRQLAYATNAYNDYKIYICDTPPDVLAQARTSARKKAALRDLLNSDATRHPPAGRRRPPIVVTPMVPRPLPTVEHQQPVFPRLGNFIRFSPRTNAVRAGRNDQPLDPLDFSATSPLPRPLSGHTSTQGRSVMNPGENSRQLPTTSSSPSPFTTRIHNVSSLWPVRGGHIQPRIVDVPLAQAKERNAAAGAPKKDEDIVPDEFLDPPSPNPNSQQPAAAVQPAPGEHGGDRSCFCF